MAASAMDWRILEDGSLSIGEKTRGISYHPKLNTLLVVTEDSSIQVLDVNTGVVLQKSTLCAEPGSVVECKYLNEVEQVLFKCDSSVGLRKDISGVLLLDSALQAPINKADDFVVIELTHNEATQLLSCLKNTVLPGLEYLEEVRDCLQMGIMSCQGAVDHDNHKVAKWATVKLDLPHTALCSVCSSLITELKRVNQNVPGLCIASAILDRLHTLYPASQPDRLLPGSSRTVDRSLMYTEAARRDTFTSWPHMDYKWALPDAMAQAGFYHGPTTVGDDRALCFTCSVCLVCWEPTDEPWSEHERHSPNCPHVRGEHTQNVPLAITLASGPAQKQGGKSNHICCISSSTSKQFVATATVNGNICLWDVNRQLKGFSQFTVKIANSEGTSKVRESQPQVKKAWLEDADQICAKQKDPKEFEEPSEDQPDPNEKDEGYGTISDFPGKWSNTKNTDSTDICKKLRVTALHIMDGDSLMESEIPPTAVKEDKIGESKKENKTVCYIFVGIRAHLADNPSRLLNETSSVFNSEENISSQAFLAIYSTSVTETEKKQLIRKPKTKSKSLTSEMAALKTGGVSSLSELLMPQVMSHTFTLPPVESPCLLDDSQESAMIGTIESSTQTKFNISVKFPPHIDQENLYVSSVFTSTDPNCIVVILSPIDCLHVVSDVDSSKCNIRVHVDEDISISKGLSQNTCAKHASKNIVDTGYVGLNGQDVCGNISTSSFSSISAEGMSYIGTDEVDLGKPVDTKSSTLFGGYIIVYSICSDDDGIIQMLKLQKLFRIEDPNRSLRDVVLLPLEIGESSSEKSEDIVDSANRDALASAPDSIHHSFDQNEVNGNLAQNLGQFTALTKEGGVIFMDIGTCNTLAYLPPLQVDARGKDSKAMATDPFAALTYCTGMERLCVCTESGQLRFLQLEQVKLSYQSTVDDVDSDAPSLSMGQVHEDQALLQSPECLVNQPITAESLTQLTELTKFETLIPRFSATVPPCWMEIQQEQQQRRHPQHLHQKHHGDATQHTRTWKLASNGAEEHLFELVLPKPSIVGHIDVKLNFQHFCDRVPNIQITLLKQTSQHGLGKDSTPVDTPIDFNMDMLFSERKEQSTDKHPCSHTSLNVLLYEMEREVEEKMKSPFLESHKNDIICGPLTLDSSIDIPGCSGLVTLTSHELMKSKYRSFLLHICSTETPKVEAGRSTKSNQKGPFILTMFQNPPPVTPSEQISAIALTKDLDKINGCDWIQEISITKKKKVPTATLR